MRPITKRTEDRRKDNRGVVFREGWTYGAAERSGHLGDRRKVVSAEERNMMLAGMPSSEQVNIDQMKAAWEEFKHTKLFAVLIGHLEVADKVLACEGTIWGFFSNGYMAGAKR